MAEIVYRRSPCGAGAAFGWLFCLSIMVYYTSEHLRDYFTGAETWRANEIARTEATAATGRGQLEAVYQMDPTMGKGWLIEDDPHTRETHRAAGERYSDPIALDDDFEVGQDKMQSPGTGDLADENCNCRCGIVFMPMEEK